MVRFHDSSVISLSVEDKKHDMEEFTKNELASFARTWSARQFPSLGSARWDVIEAALLKDNVESASVLFDYGATF